MRALHQLELPTPLPAITADTTVTPEWDNLYSHSRKCLQTVTTTVLLHHTLRHTDANQYIVSVKR